MILLSKIAEIVGGEIDGDPDCQIESIASLESATENSISFFSDPKKSKSLNSTQAAAILISRKNSGLFSGNKIIVNDAYLAYAQMSKLFKTYVTLSTPGIAKTAVVSDHSTVSKSAGIGEFVTISNGAKIGDNVVLGNCVNIGEGVEIDCDTIIEDQVVIYPGCRIGKRCTISSGAIIGSSGFGYAPNSNKWEKIEQLGSVVIGDDVDIGANTTIDRGALENTVVGNGVKLDNQIQIAHNVQIGENTIMAGCVGIAGSAQIGKCCKIGARVTILGHLEIADNVTVLSNSLVTNSIKSAGEYASSISVQPVNQWRKNAANIRRLDKLFDKVKQLSKQRTK